MDLEGGKVPDGEANGKAPAVFHPALVQGCHCGGGHGHFNEPDDVGGYCEQDGGLHC